MSPERAINFRALKRNTRGLEAFMLTIRKFLRDENGATAIEYGLIAAGISVAIIATVTSLGGKLVTVFGKVDTALN